MSQTKKTNALRMLDAEHVSYESREYQLSDGFTSGSDIARMLNLDPDEVFKTLVTESGSGDHFVCVIPVDWELDLKKAARHFGVKKMEMLPMKKLLPLTGYVHGGCSPIGMKKKFPTVIDETATLFESICVSGGRIGLQLRVKPEDLARMAEAEFADLTVT